METNHSCIRRSYATEEAPQGLASADAMIVGQLPYLSEKAESWSALWGISSGIDLAADKTRRRRVTIHSI